MGKTLGSQTETIRYSPQMVYRPLMERFAEETYNNLELTGFYWLEESTAKCGDLPKDVSEYIHQLDKRFYWIPYWNASGYNLWKKLGFDTAFLQPNHFFSKDIPDIRLDQACNTARKFGMGLEMEFDSNVLYEKEDSYYSRLESYINAFENNGVFEESSIAYYSEPRESSICTVQTLSRIRLFWTGLPATS